MRYSHFYGRKIPAHKPSLYIAYLRVVVGFHLRVLLDPKKTPRTIGTTRHSNEFLCRTERIPLRGQHFRLGYRLRKRKVIQLSVIFVL